MSDLALSPPQVPLLMTPRLVLRGHRLEDFRACASMWADPVVTRHIGGKPFSPEESWSRLLRYAGHWCCMGFGYWAIEEKSTGSFVGETGFAEFRREIQPSVEGLPEVGWAFATRVHGRGYATEAVRAVVEWGDTHLQSKRSVCLIDPENLASLRVAEKCGYAEYHRTDYKGHSIVLCARERPSRTAENG